ncbi:hypothetical protein [Roseibium suaedae]|uniref:Uncharacterized protein n=1 Tax=Roseibium suaedae TaxID=735517 RepID=A0A1M7LC80_9HYPH|nr:hypothetical protein [Roseibium suaedae]SHM75478.1 hypothetical protein SAMN05444272_3152 [Roseibium suaedae]
MRRLIQIQSITRRNRHEVNRLIFDTVAALGGWVDDVQMYSNIMSTIRLTLSLGRYSLLAETLAGSGIPIELPDSLKANPSETREQSASLQITFVHNEPDLRREIPAVPG